MFSDFGWPGVIFLLRALGASSTHQALKHPLIRDGFYLIAKGAGEGEAPSNSYTALKKTTQLNPGVIAEIDLWLTKDRHWVLYGDGVFKTAEGDKGSLHEWKLEELKKKTLLFGEDSPPQGLSLLTLEEVLSSFPETNFLLDIHHYEEAALGRLIEMIRRWQAQERILVHSLFPQVLRLLRQKEPRWLFFPSPPEVMQAQVMSSLFLETMMDLSFDFIFQDLRGKNPSLSSRLQIECLRQNRKIIAAIDSLNHWEQSNTSLKIHGVLTPRPSEFVSYLHKKE